MTIAHSDRGLCGSSFPRSSRRSEARTARLPPGLGQGPEESRWTSGHAGHSSLCLRFLMQKLSASLLLRQSRVRPLLPQMGNPGDLPALPTVWCARPLVGTGKWGRASSLPARSHLCQVVPSTFSGTLRTAAPWGSHSNSLNSPKSLYPLTRPLHLQAFFSKHVHAHVFEGPCGRTFEVIHRINSVR